MKDNLGKPAMGMTERQCFSKKTRERAELVKVNLQAALGFRVEVYIGDMTIMCEAGQAWGMRGWWFQILTHPRSGHDEFAQRFESWSLGHCEQWWATPEEAAEQYLAAFKRWETADRRAGRSREDHFTLEKRHDHAR